MGVVIQRGTSTSYEYLFRPVKQCHIHKSFIGISRWDGEMKDCSNCLDHMTNMAAMPIYNKNLKNLLLWNQKAYDIETWYTASGTQVLPNLFKR